MRFSADMVCMDTCLPPDQRRGGGEEKQLRASQQLQHLPSPCRWLLTKNGCTLNVDLNQLLMVAQ